MTKKTAKEKRKELREELRLYFQNNKFCYKFVGNKCTYTSEEHKKNLTELFTKIELLEEFIA